MTLQKVLSRVRQAVEDYHMIEEGDRIAVGVDARDGYVAVSGWKELSAEKGVDFCRRLRDAGVQTVIYTDISRDGAEQGTNLALYRELAKIEGLDITASGGVSSNAVNSSSRGGKTVCVS